MSKKKNKKGIKILISIVILLALGISCVMIIPGFVSAKTSNTTAQSSVQTRKITVGTQDIKQTVSGSGEIITGDDELLEADTDKTVDTVSAVEGTSVKKGAVLLTYTDGTTITAPFNGVISKVTTADSSSSSQQNNANVKDSIDIMSIDNLVTKLSVDETDLKNIKIGQVANITVNAYPDVKYTGKVLSIAETGTYQNGSSKFDVVIKFDKPLNIKIGMSAAVEITVKSVTNAVAVPIEAVAGSGKNASVMLVNSDGIVSPTPVTLGLSNDAYVQIISGISAGDTIQYTVQSSNSSRNIGFGQFGRTGIMGQNGNMSGGFSNGNRSYNDGNGSKKNG